MHNIRALAKYIILFINLMIFSLLIALPVQPQNGDLNIPEDQKPADANGHTFGGAIQYPESYQVFVYKPVHTVDAKQEYFIRITDQLLRDNLSIQKQVYVPDPAPVKIFYPYPPLKDASGRPIEDPHSNFTGVNPPPPGYYDLKWQQVKYARFNAATDFKNIKGDGLRKSTYHLFQKYSPASESHSYRLSLYLYYADTLISEQSYEFNEEQAVAVTREASRVIRQKLSGPKAGTLQITCNEDRASVYIDNHFIGKTPISYAHLPPLKYTVTIRKEGFEAFKKKVIVPSNKQIEVQAQLKPITGKGELNIITSPLEAQVYLGVIYKGQTPLVLHDVPYGIHRLHIKKEGYISRYKSIELNEKNRKSQLKISLSKGSNDQFYRVNPPVVLGLTYKDLFYGGLGFSAVSAASALYFLIQRDKVEEQLYRDLSTSDPDQFTANDYALIDSAGNKSNRYQNSATGLFIAAGTGLVLSVVMFIKYLESQDLEIASVEPNKNGPAEVVASDSLHSAMPMPRFVLNSSYNAEAPVSVAAQYRF